MISNIKGKSKVYSFLHVLYAFCLAIYFYYISLVTFISFRMDDKEYDFLGCSSNVLHRNDRSNVVYCTEENWQSVALALSQVISWILNVLEFLSLITKNDLEFIWNNLIHYLICCEGIRVAWLSTYLFKWGRSGWKLRYNFFSKHVLDDAWKLSILLKSYKRYGR